MRHGTWTAVVGSEIKMALATALVQRKSVATMLYILLCRNEFRNDQIPMSYYCTTGSDLSAVLNLEITIIVDGYVRRTLMRTLCQYCNICVGAQQDPRFLLNSVSPG